MPISLPNPSALPVSSATWHRASALPNVSSMPPVCSVVSTPIWKSSMAAATVAPKEIGSMACSLHSMLT